jgi:hypothetical protein
MTNRTEDEVIAEISLVKQMRLKLLNGESISEAYFASADSSRRYVFSTMTIKDYNEWLSALEQELAEIQGTTGIKFASGMNIPMFYRKGGV